MKKTLITIGLTSVVVLTLVGLVTSSIGRQVTDTYRYSTRGLDVGMGGGGAPVESAAMPAMAPAADMFLAPAVG